MRSETMPSIVQIEANELQKLIAEVKETVATGVNVKSFQPKQQLFGIVDLWNIRKSVKPAGRVRNKWSM